MRILPLALCAFAIACVAAQVAPEQQQQQQQGISDALFFFLSRPLTALPENHQHLHEIDFSMKSTYTAFVLIHSWVILTYIISYHVNS